MTLVLFFIYFRAFKNIDIGVGFINLYGFNLGVMIGFLLVLLSVISCSNFYYISIFRARK